MYEYSKYLRVPGHGLEKKALDALTEHRCFPSHLGGTARERGRGGEEREFKSLVMIITQTALICAAVSHLRDISVRLLFCLQLVFAGRL